MTIRILACAMWIALFGGLAQAAAAAEPRVVVFGGDLDYPPYEWLENGKPKGFLIDIEDAIARAGKADANHKQAPWPETMAALKSEAVDIVPMFRSDEREKNFWFSRPVFYAHHAIFTKSDPGRVTDLSALRLWRVAVEKSSFAHDQIVAGHPVGELVLASNTNDALGLLADGRADYAVLADQPSVRLISKLRMPVSKVGTPFWPREYSFAVRRDRPELIAWVDRNLDEVITSGEFQRIQAEWQAELDNPLPAVPLWLVKGWAPFAALVIGAFGILIFVLLRVRSGLVKERDRRDAAERDASFLVEHDRATGLPRRSKFETDANSLLKSSGGDRLKLVVLRTEDVRRGENKLSSEEFSIAQSLVGESLRDLALLSGYLCDKRFAAVISAGTTHGIVETIGRTLHHAGYEIELAWGGARFPEHGRDTHDLLKRAELALSACSASGRRWAVFDFAMESSLEADRLVRDFLAFGKDDVFAVYQPQLDLESGRITGAEALARWNHRELGPIAPDEFIPRLEKVGLLGQLTVRMIDEAIKESVRFRAKGFPIKVSVNVSAQDFADRDLPDLIDIRLRELGARPEDLTVELTESGVVTDPDLVRSTLAKLHRIGVRAAIDDFGTGFASLASFTELPFQELKIDRLFIERMRDSLSHREAVGSAINLARRMKMEVVAEGAPDLATIQLLKRMRCTRVQSFAISPPLLPDELISFLREFGLKDIFGGPRADRLKLVGGLA